MAKVLVTGANGFIGQNLVEQLACRGDDVTCLVRKSSGWEPPSRLAVRCVYGEITAPESLPNTLWNVDVVYHVAGCVRALRSREMYFVNELATARVADACATRTSPPVLVFVSSLAAGGPSGFDRPHVEADPALPVSHYGKSKLAAEGQLRKRASRQPISIVRPPVVFGPGSHTMLPMFKSVRMGLHFVPGLRPQRVSLIDVGNLNEVLIRAAARGKRLMGPEDPSCQGLYYATLPEMPTFTELGRLIAGALPQRRPWIIPTPHALGWLLAGVNAVRSRFLGRALLLNADKMREAIAGSWTCRGDRAAEQLGFRVSHSLEELLRQSCQWYRHQGWL